MGKIRALGMLAAVVGATVLIPPAPSLAENPAADCGSVSGYQPGSPWPAFGRCSTRIGVSSAIGARTNTLNWKKDLGANVRSPVVAADGTIYAGGGFNLFAYSSTGNKLWQTNLWGNIASAPAIGVDGTVYVVSAAGALSAVNPSNGAHKWDYRGAWGTAINTSPLIGADGTIYFVDTANFVHAVAPNGVAKWKRLFPGPIFSSLTMSRDGQTLYVGSSLLGLRALAVSNGDIRWVNLSQMGQYSAPAIGTDGTIYVGSSTGDFYALSPFDGKERFKANHRTLLNDTWGGISVSPSLTPEGNVVFGTDKGLLVKLTPKGAIVWEKQLNGGKVTGSPSVDAEGVIYIGTDSKKVIAVNPAGTAIWSYTTGNAVWSAPAIGKQGTIYVGANDNNLYSIGIGAEDPFGTPLPPKPGLPIVPIGIVGGSSICTDTETGLRYACESSNSQPNSNGDATYCSALKTPSQLEAVGPAPNKTLPSGWMLNTQAMNVSYFEGTSAIGDEYFTTNGLKSVGTTDDGASQCSAHLCTWSSDNGRAGVQLSAADEALLLSDHARPSCDPVPGMPRDPACTVLPAALAVPCEAVTSGATSCLTANYTKVRYDLPVCGDDTMCPPKHSCASVCPQDPNKPGSPSVCNLAVEGDTPNTTVDERTARCVPLEDNVNCQGGLQPLAAGDSCHVVSECERAEDVLTENDATPTCFNDAGQEVPCDDPGIHAEQTAKALDPKDPVEKKFATVYDDTNVNQIAGGEPIGSICKLSQNDNRYDRNNNGGSPVAKTKKQKKWGIDTKAVFDTNFGLKPGPFGIVLPSADATARFDIIGTVMGRNITVFSLGGMAKADLEHQDVLSTASAKLFGQDIAKVKAGANLRHGVTGEADAINPSTELAKLTTELQQVGASAKARLAQLTRVYQLAMKAPEIGNAFPSFITRKLCKQVLREVTYQAKHIVGDRVQEFVDGNKKKFLKRVNGTIDELYFIPENEVLPTDPEQLKTRLKELTDQLQANATAFTKVQLDPICDGPLTAETARLVMNKLAANYTKAADGIAGEMDAIFSSVPKPPYLKQTPWQAAQEQFKQVNAKLEQSKSATWEDDEQEGDGYKSHAFVGATEQRFSLIGARATFPIGPIALVLEIQGTGFWGINGKLEYGFGYNLNKAFEQNSVPLHAFARALVTPYAGVEVDAYVGVGFDFGIGGASVGIDGQITLIRLDVPVGGGIELRVRNVGEDNARPWPAQFAAMAKPVTGSQPLPRVKLAKFQLELVGNVQAGIQFSALSGNVGLSLRVRLLFFKKTWRKKLASFEGFSKAINWVGTFTVPIGKALPAPGLDPLPNFGDQGLATPNYNVLPSMPFPDVSDIDVNKFQALLPKVNNLVPPGDGDIPGFENFMLTNANFFDFDWDPRSTQEAWKQRGEYPQELTQATLDALNYVADHEDLKNIPKECALTKNADPTPPGNPDGELL